MRSMAAVLDVPCKFPEDCENYLEGWWTPLEGEAKLVKDCAKRRTMMMVQDLYNRTISLQQAQEEQRNNSEKALMAFARLSSEALKTLTTIKNDNPDIVLIES